MMDWLKKNRVCFWELLVLALMSGLCGCSAFRDFFDDDRIERRQAPETKQKTGGNSVGRDPLADILKPDDSRPYLDGADLSPEERQVLQESVSGADNRRLVESLKSDDDVARQRRREWVFGKSPFKSE